MLKVGGKCKSRLNSNCNIFELRENIIYFCVAYAVQNLRYQFSHLKTTIYVINNFHEKIGVTASKHFCFQLIFFYAKEEKMSNKLRLEARLSTKLQN